MSKLSESVPAANEVSRTETMPLPKCLYRPDDGEKFLLGKDNTYYMEKSHMKPPYRYSYEKLMECGFLTLEEFVQRRRLMEGPDPRNGHDSKNPPNFTNEDETALIATMASRIFAGEISLSGGSSAKDAVAAAREILKIAQEKSL